MENKTNTIITIITAIAVAYSISSLRNRVEELESLTNGLEDVVFQLKSDLASCECGD
jgi:hypothetical protein